jgi:hypothetical protein
MEKNIKVRATLVRASKFDVFTKDELPRENKILFFKDPFTKEFRDIYRIPGTDAYWIVELYNMLHLGCLYVVTENHHENDFCFKLILRPADDFDFFYTPRHVKTNTVYYVRNGNEVHGPHILPEHADILKLKSGIENGILYVPGKQLFEPFKLKKSA